MATRTRRTLYSYILSHFHPGGISNYFFKSPSANLVLSAPTKRKLIRILGLTVNEDNGQLHLEKIENVRVIE